MELSVDAYLRPSGDDVAAMHAGERQMYSHPTMKKGRSMSYILTGPELIRPLLMSGAEQLGHAIPLKTRGCGSQYRKRCSEGVLAVDAEAVREKYAGLEGSQKVFRMEYSDGIGCIWVGLGAKETKWDLNASSTVGPALETGLGAARAAKRVLRKAFGFVRARSPHSLSPLPREGSIWKAGGGGAAGGIGALMENPYGTGGYPTPGYCN